MAQRLTAWQGGKLLARCLFVLSLGLYTPAWATVQTGLDWLTAQAQPDGSYVTPSTISTPFQATSATLRTLHLLNAGAHASVPAARQFLGAEPSPPTEYLVRQIIASADAGEDTDALLSDLLRRQNLDGGFGDLAGYASTVLDTTFALEALAAAGHHDTPVTSMAVGFLLTRQQPDGGWSDSAAASSVYLTALALRSLWLYRHVFMLTPALEAAQAFLLGQRTSGVWGEPFETALALVAVLPRLADTSLVADSLSALEHTQQTNGSWSDDVYTTALALQALILARQPVPNPDLGSLQGRVIDGDSGMSLPGVTVTLSGTADATLVTDSDGVFQFHGLTAGDYTLTVSLSGYSAVTTVTSLSSGGRIDFGDLILLKELAGSTTGTVRGTVTDAETHIPLAGVTVTAGSYTAVTGSDGSYQISNVAAGQITVAARLDGYASASGTATLPTGGILVFSPSLAPDTTLTAALFGSITDADSGTPLPNVTVSVAGSTTASVQTDSNGTFRIEPLAVGTITIEARLTGYDTVRATATVFENSQLQFSPALHATGTTPPGANASSITGVVLDAATNVPLAGVTVQAMYDNSTAKFMTADDGRFLIGAITSAEVRLQFTLEGYTSSDFSLPIEPLSTLDIGQVRLRPKAVQALQPDLLITAIDTQDAATDPHTLVLSGSVSVTIVNQGTSPASGPFVVLAFDDTNRNGQFDTDTDPFLGLVTVEDRLAPDAQTIVRLDVGGELPFRDAPLAVWVDSAQSVVELDEDNNVSRSSNSCAVEPVHGTLEPVVKWEWTSSPTLSMFDQVMSMPVVVPLEDTNGDGRTDQQDTPGIVFHAFAGSQYRQNGVLRAVSGADGHELWTVTDLAYRTDPRGSIAAADIDGDGFVEIIVPKYLGGILVFEHDGQHKWTSSILSQVRAGGAAVADLDGDGTPEIVVGNTVLNADGSLRWQGSGYMGGNSFGMFSAIADLDLDGSPEVVAGASAYTSDGQLLWKNTAVGDGYTAIGNFDDTPSPEIVVIYRGRVHLLDSQGTILWGPVGLPGGGWGGPPTVADMDGDGRPEIGIAGARSYNVFDTDGSLLWAVPTQDVSSQITGSSVFDFDGDGQAEVVYADEHHLRIYRGTDGQVLFETANSSGTLAELPVIADVDNDDHAEIVVCANDYAWGGNKGLRVFSNLDNHWVNTRRIWNQHTYHITNVNDDGTIPASEEPSWLGHNTYRLNTFPDWSPLASADLSVSALKVVDHGTSQPLSLRVRVGNGGILTLSKPTIVAFYQGDPDTGGARLGSIAIPQITGGGYRDVQLDAVTLTSSEDLYAVVDPDDDITECNESNNVIVSPVTSAASQGRIAVATDAPAYGPDSPVLLNTTITNTGSLAAAYEVQLRITDGSGASVATFTPLSTATLAGGASVTLSQTWNTGTILAGSYVLGGTLYDLNGNVLHEATDTFIITEATARQATLRLTSDRAVYHTTAPITLAALARNLTNNVLLSGTTVELHVLAPGGGTVYSTILTVGDLAPETQHEVATIFSLQAGTEGSYTIVARLKDARGTVLASTQTVFEVVEQLGLTLHGRVDVQHAVVEAGDPQVCTDTVTNYGTQGLHAQPIRRLVADIANELLAMDTEGIVELAPGASRTLVRSIETASLPPGDYACVLQARIADTWQTLAATVFTVQEPPFDLTAELVLGERGRVLVLLDGPDATSCSSTSRDGCHEPHESAGAPPLLEQQSYLETLLTWAGWTSTVVTAAEDFTREFRSGGYTTYVVLSEQVRLPEQVQDELREAVYRGEGLIVAGDHDQRNGRLDQPLGLRFRGKTPQATGVSLTDSALHPGAQVILLLDDMVKQTELDGAIAVGYFQLRGGGGGGKGPDQTGDGIAAVTVYDYGIGRSVAMGFDLLAEATLAGQESVFASLLLRALDYVQPVAPATLPGAVVPVYLTLTGQGSVPPVQAVLTVPLEARVVAAEPTVGTIETSADDELIWSVNLANAAPESLLLWLRLPDEPGPADLHVTLLLGEVSALGDYDSCNLTLGVEPRPSFDAAQSDLAELVSRNKTYLQAQQRLEQADQAFARGDEAKALTLLVQSAEALIRIGTPEADQVRYAVAEALRQAAQWLVDF